MNDFLPVVVVACIDLCWFPALLGSHADSIPPLQSTFVDRFGEYVSAAFTADFFLVLLFLNVELLEIGLNIDVLIFWKRLVDQTKI